MNVKSPIWRMCRSFSLKALSIRRVCLILGADLLILMAATKARMGGSFRLPCAWGPDCSLR